MAHTRHALRVNDIVLHPIYGEGRILRLTPAKTHAFVKFTNAKAISGFYHYTLLVISPKTLKERIDALT